MVLISNLTLPTGAGLVAGTVGEGAEVGGAVGIGSEVGVGTGVSPPEGKGDALTGVSDGSG